MSPIQLIRKFSTAMVMKTSAECIHVLTHKWRIIFHGHVFNNVIFYFSYVRRMYPSIGLCFVLTNSQYQI